MNILEKEIMDNVKKTYLKIERKLELKQFGMLDDLTDFDYRCIDMIKYALSELSFDLEMIIRNDYLARHRNKKWWHGFFSKSTYYRRKRKAVASFVDCFKF